MKKIKTMLLLIVVLLCCSILFGGEGRLIELSWDNVAGISLEENLSLKMNYLDAQSQEMAVKKAWGNFLPRLDYQWVWSDDELSQAQMPFPVDNAFVHSLNLTYPLYAGGARWANLKLQQAQRRSILAELEGTEAAVIEQGLQAFYQVILAKEQVEVYEESELLASENLEQVESFQKAGIATELAVMQARTRYFEVIPLLSSAKNQERLALNHLKLVLNLNESDSLIVTGELEEQMLLGGYKQLALHEYKVLARDNREEIRQVSAQKQMIDQQKRLSLSAFMPTLALTASSSYYAYSDDYWIESEEFEGYNTVGLVVQMPLFSGGEHYYDYKSAGYSQKKLALLEELTSDQIELEAEQAYYNYVEARDNLKSLKEALITAEESLRLAQLYYEQGMSTQTEVLNAQLGFTQNKLALAGGKYAYNTSQLSLLKAIGDLKSILKK